MVLFDYFENLVEEVVFGDGELILQQLDELRSLDFARTDMRPEAARMMKLGT